MKPIQSSIQLAGLLLAMAPMLGSAAVGPVPKQLAGVPSEFAMMAPANPISAAIHSKSALLPVVLEKAANGRFSWSTTVPVEGENLRFVVFSGTSNSWSVSMQDPVSKRIQPAEQLALEKRAVNWDLGGSSVPADLYTFKNVPRGDWKLSVESVRADAGFVLVEAEGSERLFSHQVAFNQLLGQRIGLVASVYDLEKSAAAFGAEALSEVSIRVTAPDGSVRRGAMFDDGLHQDSMANDGVFGADFLADQAGAFNAQVLVRGHNDRGGAFVRTAEHLIPVLDSDLSLRAETISSKSVSANRLSLQFDVSGAKAMASHYHVYAEVWGSSSTRGAMPVAWIGGMSDLTNGSLNLGLDTRWIAKVGARAPFELRNVRVEDADYFITVAKADRLALSTPSLPKSAAGEIAVDSEMLVGPRPANQVASKGVGRKLLLVHGYCSSDVWGPVAGQFSNAAVFKDLKQNRSHDAFARLIQTFGNTWNSYGIVAHSQGGAASLHLYNYYWSGLDNAVGSRLIQSVGTPYRGTALAGNAAALGSVFGVGCGTNSNMTYSGAASWLAGIATSSRAKATFFTTSFTDRAWVYDYCNLVTDVLLSDPDDGTTEKTYGQLPSGVNGGHKTGWCHTSGMRDPAQTTDSSRNTSMSANAAR